MKFCDYDPLGKSNVIVSLSADELLDILFAVQTAKSATKKDQPTFSQKCDSLAKELTAISDEVDKQIFYYKQS